MIDLSFLEDPIPNIAALINVAPSTVLFYLGLICAGANILARMIPDDATGWKGVVRDIAKVVGLYTQNRVTTGVKTGDVIKGIIQSRVERRQDGKLQTLELDEVVPAPVAEAIEDELSPTPAPVPAFPGLIAKNKQELDEFDNPKELY